MECQKEFRLRAWEGADAGLMLLGVGQLPVVDTYLCMEMGPTTACGPHALGGDQCGEQRGSHLKREYCTERNSYTHFFFKFGLIWRLHVHCGPLEKKTCSKLHRLSFLSYVPCLLSCRLS